MQWQIYKNSGKQLPTTFPALLKSFHDLIGNQYSWNGCTSWGTMADFIRVRVAEGFPRERYSRLAEFWMSRKLYGKQMNIPNYVDQNQGVYEDNALETLIDYGPMLEKYDPDTFNGNWFKDVQLEPPDKWMENEKLSWDQVYQIDTSNPEQKLADTLDALAHGYPVLTSMLVFDGIFNVPPDGYVPDPAPGTKDIGAHEVNICEPDMQAQRLPFPNSWGPGWGNNGDGSISFDYFKKYAYELFIIVPKKQAQPSPQPSPNSDIGAYFTTPSVKAGENNILTIIGAPGTKYKITVTSTALPKPLGAEGVIPASGQGQVTYLWPNPGTYTFTVSSGVNKTIATAEWT